MRVKVLAQKIFPRLTTKWLLQPRTRQTDGDKVTVPSACVVARQRGRSFGIRLSEIVSLHPHGHMKDADQGFGPSPIK